MGTQSTWGPRQHEGGSREGAARQHVPVRLLAALAHQGPRLLFDGARLVRGGSAQRGEGAPRQVQGQHWRGRGRLRAYHRARTASANHVLGTGRGTLASPLSTYVISTCVGSTQITLSELCAE